MPRTSYNRKNGTKLSTCVECSPEGRTLHEQGSGVWWCTNCKHETPTRFRGPTAEDEAVIADLTAMLAAMED